MGELVDKWRRVSVKRYLAVGWLAGHGVDYILAVRNYNLLTTTELGVLLVLD